MSGFITASCYRLCYIPLKSALDADATTVAAADVADAADAPVVAVPPTADACRNIVLNFIERCL